MAISSDLPDPPSLLHDLGTLARLAPTARDRETLVALLAGLSDHDSAAAQTLLAGLRQRVDALERQEREAPAMPEYDGPKVIWSYSLSEPTRAYRTLLVALEAVVLRRSDRAA